jgi:uncharacterized protein
MAKSIKDKLISWGLSKVITPTFIQDNLQNVMETAHQRRRDVTNPLNNFYTADFTLNPAMLENIYLSSWIAKKLVSDVTELVFKNGYEFSIPEHPDLEKAVLEKWEELGLDYTKNKVNKDKKIYGGGVIIIKNPYQDPSKPLDMSLLQMAGDRLELSAVDYTYCGVYPHTDITNHLYFQPKTISVAGFTGDESNFIIFKGVQVPTRRMPQFRYIGMSIFQNIYQAMIADDYVSKGVANMVWRDSTRYYYKVNGLADLVANCESNVVLERLTLLEDSINMLGAGVIDKEDDVLSLPANFSNLDAIMQQTVQRLAAATNLPATWILNKSPDGQNSTGESDKEMLYNAIEAEQKEITPNMKKIFNIIIHSITGKPVEFEFEFNKPNHISRDKEADTNTKILANAKSMQDLGMPDDIIIKYMVDNGLITNEEGEEIDQLQSEAAMLAEQAQAEGMDKDADSKD